MLNWLIGTTVAFIFLAATGALILAALSRHRKAGAGPLTVLGARGHVTTTLQPEGAVLLNGELWPARASDAATLISGTKVEVVATKGTLLLVQEVG